MADQSPAPSLATVYGYPRQGDNRALKRAIESHWSGSISADELVTRASSLRLERLRELSDAGLGELPSNDFSLYDHVLDTAVLFGALPRRYRLAAAGDNTMVKLDRYFAMARGTAELAPLEMTKWFDTNYHYLVPELDPDQPFALDATKPLIELAEARALGVAARPVVLGPISFLLLAKPASGTPEGFSPLSLLDRLLPSYVDLLGQLAEAGADWVQLDEPVLVTDQPDAVLSETARAYRELGTSPSRPKLLVASYFDRLGEALPVLADSPVEGLALDFTGRAAANLDALQVLGGLPGKRLVAGVVDGRNVWATDLGRALDTLEALRSFAARVDVAASCSLLHVPLALDGEHELNAEVRPWLAFAREKLGELVTLARGLSEGRETIGDELRASNNRAQEHSSSPRVRVAAVRERVSAISAHDLRRSRHYVERRAAQQVRLGLSILPTTTIGSFPQTDELRAARAALSRGRLDLETYEEVMREEIRAVVIEQEELGLDVLVHGEPERNDMVQYFAEQLDGFLVTEHGWVQSYGTRYVRPPIIVGDVSRPHQMTLSWSSFAQSLTSRPMKAMLTGPVTMLAWSFVRDDQPLAETARQVALALREEVADLEAAGLPIIQVDEPALRELAPLRRVDRSGYLDWAVEAFRLATSGARDETQVHTHMCYAEFGDVLDAIIAMDADVISLEAARSQMTIADDLARAQYPNDVGLGVWDIHSPRVPSIDELCTAITGCLAVFPPERVWVNPDCGLKTRRYPEVRASLVNMVAAAHQVRRQLGG